MVSSNLENNRPGYSRRSALLSCTAGAFAALTYSYRDNILDQILPITEAEEKFVNFPDQFEGVREIIKHRSRGAQHCLVHIQQLHVNLETDNTAFAGAKLSQESIRDVLRAFRVDSRVNLNKLYSEGEAGPATENEARVLDRLFRMIASPRGATQDQLLTFLQPFPPELQSQTIKLLKDQATLKLRAKMQGIISAPYDLEREGLTIIPAEDLQLREREGKDFDPIESRSRALLAMIVSNQDQISFTTFGVAHDFAATIIEWNKANPAHKFCLIEVLSEGTAVALENKLY